MRIFILLIIFSVLQYPANSQETLREPISGRPYLLAVYQNINGTPFLFENWKPANVTDNRGTAFLDVMVKFDIYANKFFYNHGDTTYEFITPISKVELFPFQGDTVTKMVFKKGFWVGEELSVSKFVQVLAEGKITAIKFIRKTQQETIGYGVPGKIKTFSDNMTYYFIKDGNAVSQKPGPKLLQEILKDKWSVIDTYMKQNSLSPRSENDCIKAIKYYNTL